MSHSAAIHFEPDGYVLSGPKLMGRQATGQAFLRAAVAGRENAPLYAHTPHKRSAAVFARLVREIDPAARVGWCPPGRFDLLQRIGTLYLPSPQLTSPARLRLRAGPAAYSLCGVTHTTASHRVMDYISGMLTAPVMPWDALVCTSQAVAETVRQVLRAEAAYLRWRLGSAAQLTAPQLPVIPLGVHSGDFVFSEAERAAARAALGIADDETVALFVGRLSFHAKAHPHAMYAGLQEAARRSGRKLALIQCGWFANAPIEKAFRTGARMTCPDVRCLFTDGKDARARQQSWAAADLFISLSDNVQETFGLSPLEAMAAGIPVVVTDWDGYKDTVRDGVDGFRIPTAMLPPTVLGSELACAYETGRDSYDIYCAMASQACSVDMRTLADRLVDLVVNPELRHHLGSAGRARAREVFDWAAVFREYQALWGELGRRRAAARNHEGWKQRLAAAPHVAAPRMNPFRLFGHYATFRIEADTLVKSVPGVSAETYRRLARHPLFNYARSILPSAPVVERLLAASADPGLDVRSLAERAGLGIRPTILAVSILGKMGLVELTPPRQEEQDDDLAEESARDRPHAGRCLK